MEFMSKKVRKVLILVCIFCFGISLGAGSVWASNSYGIWHNGFTPIPAYIGCFYSLSSETKAAVHNACVEWNNAGAGSLVYRNTSDSYTSMYPFKNGKNDITKGDRGTNRYLMQCNMTNYYYTGSTTYPKDQLKVTEADIDINGSYPWSNSYDPNCYHVQSVITHEIGHLLGLNDIYTSSEWSLTMYGYSSTGETFRQSLDDGDKAGINLIY